MHVLVVEDDSRMSALLRQGLSEEGYVVTVAKNGPEALAIARSAEFDAIVLDIMLPGLDGISVARQLRSEGNRTPILMLTARDQISDVVAGLNIGADDYLTKPFSFAELLARVKAVSRRGPIPRSVVLQCSDLELDTGARTASRAGRPISLTRTEYLLLELLMRRAGQVVPREAILDSVWGFDKGVEPNTLDAFVRLLRTKVDQGHPRRLICTVRGIGYALREEGQ
jgi:DNA-binding response OmpR family regulator